jgi:hypothetical protein
MLLLGLKLQYGKITKATKTEEMTGLQICRRTTIPETAHKREPQILAQLFCNLIKSGWCFFLIEQPAERLQDWIYRLLHPA